MLDNFRDWHKADSRDVSYSSAYEAEADMPNIPADFR
jgi:hypothetical protein